MEQLKSVKMASTRHLFVQNFWRLVDAAKIGSMACILTKEVTKKGRWQRPIHVAATCYVDDVIIHQRTERKQLVKCKSVAMQKLNGKVAVTVRVKKK
jgi:hypothetical protein